MQFGDGNHAVTLPTFLGVMWAGTATSLLFVAFRLYARLKTFKRLFLDDWLVIAAWMVMLATSILWQLFAPAMFEGYAVESGTEPFSMEFLRRDEKFLRSTGPLIILYYLCLWAVKFSLLAFFKRLASRLRSHRVWCWCVVAITTLAGAACFADPDYRCSFSSFDYIIHKCSDMENVSFMRRSFYANCVADVLTDCLIISIPIALLWNSSIPLRKKLVLMAVFSATVFVMVASIIRVVGIHSVNLPWLYFWSNIEMATAIIVACTLSFRQLFVISHKQTAKQSTKRLSTPLISPPLQSHFSTDFRARDKIRNQLTLSSWKKPTPPETAHIPVAQRGDSQNLIPTLRTFRQQQRQKQETHRNSSSHDLESYPRKPSSSYSGSTAASRTTTISCLIRPTLQRNQSESNESKILDIYKELPPPPEPVVVALEAVGAEHYLVEEEAEEQEEEQQQEEVDEEEHDDNERQADDDIEASAFSDPRPGSPAMPAQFLFRGHHYV